MALRTDISQYLVFLIALNCNQTIVELYKEGTKSNANTPGSICRNLSSKSAGELLREVVGGHVIGGFHPKIRGQGTTRGLDWVQSEDHQLDFLKAAEGC